MTNSNSRLLWKLVHQNHKPYVDPIQAAYIAKRELIHYLNTLWYGQIKADQYQLWDDVCRKGWPR